MNEVENKEIDRRKFLMKTGIWLGAVASVATLIPIVGGIFAPLLKKKEETWRAVGLEKDFVVGTTTLVKFINADPKPYAGTTAKSAAWLRRDMQNKFVAFSVNCTHLGCPVRWEANAGLFMCPCHGGVYYKDGSVAAGPPPKSLTQYMVRVYKGEVQIQTAPLPLTNLNATNS